jgi:hypothetical protein
MLPQENLGRIFSWQEERRLTGALTLHYKRVMYVIEPSPAAEAARGKRVLVREDDGGQVFIEYHGATLPARAFPKDARVQQSAIVDNGIPPISWTGLLCHVGLENCQLFFLGRREVSQRRVQPLTVAIACKSA